MRKKPLLKLTTSRELLQFPCKVSTSASGNASSTPDASRDQSESLKR